MNIKQKFREPPMSCRAFPFWAWNSRLDEEEMIRQIGEMYRMGYGGFFIHAREGLETEYMSDEWLRLVKTAAQEAKRLGMYAWLYDEDRWPSGTAGGRVTAADSPYRLTGLTLEVTREAGDISDAIAVYAAKIDGDDIFELRRSEELHLMDGEALLVMRREFSKVSEWFNGSAPPDNLNPDTVDRFIELTHERYSEAAGEYLGGTIPGIFFDEPSLADNHASFDPNRSWLPWTDGFDAYFESLHGYSFWDFAPYLYFNGAHSKKIRHDYWYAVTLKFTESFTKRIQDWCHEHGIKSTGHFLWEDRLGVAARTGGAIMPHYEYQDIPGIDILRYNTDEFLTVKQCTSAAHQLGKKNTICEIYGAAGWRLTMEDMRRIGDRLYALGINRRAQHTCLYSIAGCRKRDYPPSFAYNNPAYERIAAVEDYFARLGAVLEEGEQQADILMLHPSTTAWTMLGASPYGNPIRREERDFPKINAMGYELNEIIKELSFAHFNAELGDEIIMSRYAYVRGKSLVIGNAAYRTVILPKIGNLLSSTLRLLEEFINNGGTVIAIPPLPETVDGSEAFGIKGLLERVTEVSGIRELIGLLEKNDEREIRITGADSVLMMHRKTDGESFVFVVNTEDRSVSINIEISENAQAEQWDCLTGRITGVAAERSGEKTRLVTELKPYGSKLFRIGGTAAEMPPKAEIVMAELISAEPVDDNTLTLDRCRFAVNGGLLSEDMEVWRAQREIRGQLGMRPIHKNGGIQRYLWVNEPHKNDGTPVELRFKFENADFDGELYLAIEHPENFDVRINGKKIQNEPCGYLFDRAIKKLNVGKPRAGKNEVVLRCGYMNRHELESIYLCGAFALDARHRLNAPSTLASEVDGSQYCGRMRYRFRATVKGKHERVCLDLPEIKAVCLRLEINGAGLDIPWSSALPVDVTEHVRQGENEVYVTAYMPVDLE